MWESKRTREIEMLLVQTMKGERDRNQSGGKKSSYEKK